MIEVILEENGDVRRVTFEGLPILVGRGEDADLKLDTDRASRRHLLIEREGGQVVATDLHSANGSTKDGQPIDTVVLERGDVLELADVAHLTWLGETLDEDAPRIPGFELKGRLGTGPASAVWRARQEKMGRDVAVRLPRRRWLKDREALHQFEARARAQARMSVAGLASGIDLGRTDAGVPWFAMELLEGRTLPVALTRSGPLEPVQVARLLDDLLAVCSVVHRADQGLGHLAPGDVLVDDDGHARLTGVGHRLPLGRDLGAEEDWTIEEAEGTAADFLLVARIATYALTGERPGARLADSLEAAPTPLRRVLETLGAADPSARPASAEEAQDLISGLESTLASRAPVAAAAVGVSGGDEEAEAERPAVRRDPTAHWSPRMKFISGAISVLIIILLNVGVYFGWQALRGGDDPEPAPTPRRHAEAPPEKPEPPRPPDHLAAAQAFGGLSERVDGLVEEGHFDEAMAHLDQFVEQFAGTEATSLALERAEAVATARRDHLNGGLAEVRAALAAADLETARRRFRELDSAASRFVPEETEVVRASLAAAELAEREEVAAEARRRREERAAAEAAAREAEGPKPGPGEGEERTAPETGPETGPATAPETAPAKPGYDARALLLGAPTAESLATELAPLLAGDTLDVGHRAVLEALHRELERWPRAMAALNGKTLRLILTEGEVVEGEVAATEEGFAILSGRKRTEVPLGRLGAAGIKGILMALEPTRDRYLARALLNALTGDAGESWFDREAALLLLAEEPKVARAVDRTLRALVRRRSGDGG